MSIRFTRGRLHVGYRGKDWSDVWTEPAKDESGEKKILVSEEGEADIMLYRFTLGKAEYREPMEGEVKWHPLFDVANCESRLKLERERMQKQFLTDAYKYLEEKDPEKVRNMEDDLDQPRFSRWQTWFEEAKKFKRTQMRQRDYRRRKRTQQAVNAGATQAEIEKQVNSDTSDSAYNSDEDGMGRSRSAAHMPPPPPGPLNKRKIAKNGVARWNTGTKKQRLSNIPNGSNKHHASSLFMSGGLGSRSTSVESGKNTIASDNISTKEESFADEYEESVSDEMMDTRDPNSPPPPIILGNQTQWNFDPIAPAHTEFRTLSKKAGRSSAGSKNGENNIRNERNASVGGIQGGGEEANFEPERGAVNHIREQSALGMTDEQAFEMAIRQSHEPQGRQEDEQVADSIEKGADDFERKG